MDSKSQLKRLCVQNPVGMAERIATLESTIERMKEEIKVAAMCLTDAELNPNLDVVWASKYETLHDYLLYIAREK